MNNLFYTTEDPVLFDAGIEYKSSGQVKSPFTFKNEIEVNKQNIKQSTFNSAVTAQNKNAYTPEEIMEFFRKEKSNGNIDKKVNEYIQQNASMVSKKQLK